MPRANRTNKGNKRRAVFDRLVVPANSYQVHIDPPRLTPPDLPDTPVGQRVRILNVIIYEISRTYEGKPQKFVKTIPFGDIVGDPVSNTKIDTGTTFTTPQGETILVKWALHTDRKKQGLIVANVKADGTSWYEPNWGNIYGVGLEWVTCDGSDGGVIWANRHAGAAFLSTESDGSLHIEYDWFESTEPDYQPYCIRPGLMLGNPEPEKSLWLMGQQLPMRVFPALGEIGRGTIFRFNANVMGYVYVKPPVAPHITEYGMANVRRGDAIEINWGRDEFTEQTYVALKIVSGAESLDSLNYGQTSLTLQNGLLQRLTSNSDSMNGGFYLIGMWKLHQQLQTEMQFLLLDASDDSIIACASSTVTFTPTLYSGSVTRVGCQTDPPKDACGQAGTTPPPVVQPPSPPPPTNIGGTSVGYFCDGSVSASSVDTAYWTGAKALEPSFETAVESAYNVTFDTRFWEGRNSWLTLFSNSVSKITPQSFHKFLFKMIKDLKDGVSAEGIDVSTWAGFKTWCSGSGLTCLTDLQKASVFMSYRLKVPVNFFSAAAGYLNGTILDTMAASLEVLPNRIYDWIDFNDVIHDSGGGITGAFSADIPDIRFKAFASYVNFEPQALQYPMSAGIAHHPLDYVKLPGLMWGTPTAVDYSQYYLPDYTLSTYQPYVAAEVGIHEIGHSVAYYGLDFYGTVLHEMPEWLNISGWASDAPSKAPDDVSAHLSKSSSSSNTGGMPKTDAGYESPVSDYGCFHPAEDFAEAFRMYIVNPTFLETKYPNKFAFMVNKVEPMFV